MGARLSELLSGGDGATQQEEELRAGEQRAEFNQRTPSPSAGRTCCAPQRPMAPLDKRPKRARMLAGRRSVVAAAAAAAENRVQAPLAGQRPNKPIVGPVITRDPINISYRNNNNNESFNLNNINKSHTNRPASAMAGSLSSSSSGGGGGGGGTHDDGPVSRTPPPGSSQQQQPQQRVKTTRVRINSTSEQIQDPNWLIQMSRERELKQQAKRGFPFKSLQQKLKTTIGVGGGSSSSASSAQSSTAQQLSSLKSSNQTAISNQLPPIDNNNNNRSVEKSAFEPGQASATVPPPLPRTPIKVPVSILKQPTTNIRTLHGGGGGGGVNSSKPSTAKHRNQEPSSSTSSLLLSMSTGSTKQQQQQQQQQHSVDSSQQGPKLANSRPSASAGRTASQSGSGGGSKQIEAVTTAPVRNQSPAAKQQQQQAVAASPSDNNNHGLASKSHLAATATPTIAQISPVETSSSSSSSSGGGGGKKHVSPNISTTSIENAPSSAGGQSRPTNPATNHPPSTAAAAAAASITASQSQSQQQQQQHNKLVPICADGQVKVSGWKRKNLLAKTLSHFDEIRGNQRPIFVPTKIRLPPEKTTMTATSGGGSGSGGKASLTRASASAREPGGNKFAEVVREALLKKSLLLGAHSSSSSGGGGGGSSSPMTISAPADAAARVTAPSARSKRVSDASERHHSCDLSANPAAPTAGQVSASNFESGIRPAKRPVSAEPPGRSSVSGLSGGGGGGNGGGSSAPTSSLRASTKIKKQLHEPTNVGSAAAVSAPSHHNHHQHHHQHHHHHQLGQNGSSSATAPGAGAKTSMAQIIATVVAASSSSSAEGQRSSSFSLPSASVVSGASSRAFKLQLKNEQVLQNLRRQSGGEHRDSLKSQVMECQPDQHQESGHAASSAGGRGGSVRLKDWKRLTSKLGLLTGRSERQAFAVAVHSSGGTPVHCGQAAGGQQTPLRLTVSNQEQRRLGSRGQRGSSGGGGGGSVGDATSQGAAVHSRLLVPGGNLFEGASNGNRRHSSQSTGPRLAQAGVPASASSRKLSSSSMVVQPVSLTALASSRAPFTCVTGGLSGTNQVPSRYCARMSRSAATSPLLMASQDSMHLRRCSDSEAQRLRSSGLVPGGALEAPTLSTPATQGRSSVSAASVDKSDLASPPAFMRTAETNSPLADSTTGAHIKASPPIVVNRNDLLHLLRVTSAGSVASLSSSSSNNNTGASETCACCSNHDSLAPCSCACHSASKLIANAHPAETQTGSESSRATTQDTAEISASKDSEQQQQQQQQARKSKTDLSRLVKRTSKVAFFQQKLLKMRWHSKQKQEQKQRAELEMREQASQARPGAENDAKADANERLNNLDTRDSPGAAGEKQGQQMAESNASSGKEAGNASDVLMDPTLIGDAIEIFLRTMQHQQHEQQDDVSEDDEQIEEQNQMTRMSGSGKAAAGARGRRAEEDEREETSSGRRELQSKAWAKLPLGESTRDGGQQLDEAAARAEAAAALMGEPNDEIHQASGALLSARGRGVAKTNMRAPPTPPPPPPPPPIERDKRPQKLQHQLVAADSKLQAEQTSQVLAQNRRTKTAQIRAAIG